MDIKPFSFYLPEQRNAVVMEDEYEPPVKKEKLSDDPLFIPDTTPVPCSTPRYMAMDEDLPYHLRVKSSHFELDFWRERSLVFSFGLTFPILTRIGYNKGYQLVLKRDNPQPYKPTFIPIPVADLPAIIEYFQNTLALISNAKTEGKELPYMDSSIVKAPTGFKIISPNSYNFWSHESCFYAPSSQIRIRPLYGFGSIYTFFLNFVKESDQYLSHGPRLKLYSQDVLALLDIIKQLLKDCPDLFTLA